MRATLRQALPLLAVLAPLGAIAFAVSWSGELADLGADSTMYMMMARHLAPYVPADGIADVFFGGSLFPPLYPLLLVLSGGAADLHLAHAATAACLVVALAALHGNLLALGLPRRLALAGVVLFAALPETLARVLQVRSECLYLALSLGGLLWLARGMTSRAPRDFWLATALFALAMLTRSVGLMLLPALAIALLRARPRGWYWMPPAMLAPALLWRLMTASEQGYGSVMLGVLKAPLAAILDLLVLNGTAFAWGLAGNVLQTQALAWVLLPLAAIAGVVLLARFLRGEPDAWYLAAYFATMVAWPYPEEAQRFAWVVMPWVLAYGILGGCALAARLPAARLAEGVRWVVPAMLALLLAPSLALAVQRFQEPAERALAHLPEWYLPDAAGGREKAQAHLDITRAMAELGGLVPPGECLYSITPATAFHAGRLNVLLAEEHVGEAAFEAWLARGDCRFFLLLAVVDGTTARNVFYPRERLGDRIAVVDVRYSESAGVTRPVAALAVLRDRL